MATLTRRVFSSGNFVVTVVLLGMLFIMVNYVSSRRYGRVDLTRTKFSVLSEKTLQVLKGLETSVSVVVFYQPQMPGERPDPLYPLITNLLKEYEPYSNKLKIEYVEPYRDRARAEQLAKQFNIDRINLLIVQSGPRHKYLSDTDLVEYDYSTLGLRGEPRVKTFKGEEALTSAIINVIQTAQPLVWCTTGHGEKSLDANEPGGLADAKKVLEQQNMSVQSVTLLERSIIPPDVKLIIIPGPTHRFTETEVALLQGYLEHGGRLLALIDPLNDSGLDGLLERWGIALGMDIVVDPARQLPFVSAANLFVTTYTKHPIVEKMKTLMTLFPLARSVGPAKSSEGVTATPLALTSEAGWGETKTSDERFQFNDAEDLKGPVPIAVAAQRNQPTRTRLVVVGDSDFAVNAQLDNVGNRDLLLGAIYWLTEQEQLIGIGPKPIESIKLNLTGHQLRGIFWFSFLAMPLSVGVAGVGMWWLRRQ